MPKVCFYDFAGTFVGADGHAYATIGPLGAPLPIPLQPHICGSDFHSVTAKQWRWTKTVTSDRVSMLQGGWGLFLVPHVFVPIPPPHPLAAALLAATILTSSSSPLMSSHSVSGRGSTLAMCLSTSNGLNVDCSLPVSLPSGIVVNQNSVTTNATVGDYVAAIISYAFGAALSRAFGAAAGAAAGKIAARFASEVVKKVIVDVAAPVALAALLALIDAAASAGVPGFKQLAELLGGPGGDAAKGTGPWKR